MHRPQTLGGSWDSHVHPAPPPGASGLFPTVRPWGYSSSAADSLVTGARPASSQPRSSPGKGQQCTRHLVMARTGHIAHLPPPGDAPRALGCASPVARTVRPQSALSAPAPPAAEALPSCPSVLLPISLPRLTWTWGTREQASDQSLK